MEGNDLDKKHLVHLMTGRHVIIEHIKGPTITEENSTRVFDQGESLEGHPQARTGTFFLRGYSSLGIEVSKERGSRPSVFIAWGAILAIYTDKRREELVQEIMEDLTREQTEQTEEGNPP